MPEPVRILLVSPDLMVASRIAGLATSCGCTLDTVARLGARPPETGYRVVILDLHGLRGEPAELVKLARECLAATGPTGGSSPAIVAFGPHVAADALAAARAAGADDVVSRGELLGDFARVVGRHRG